MDAIQGAGLRLGVDPLGRSETYLGTDQRYLQGGYHSR